jgi:hypothetical protein
MWVVVVKMVSVEAATRLLITVSTFANDCFTLANT